MSTNLTPFSSAGGFTTAGNITTAAYASPAPTISGFSSVSADNFRLIAGNITGGIATVVDDGINSIAQAPGAQMDVFGFPFSGGGVRGQLTISGVTTPSEANGTWYYQSLNTYIYQIYTDSTYSTLVDATGWSAYTGGGSVAITKQVPAANIVINSNGYFSKFDNTGDLTLPSDLLLANNASITTTNATGNVVGKSINIQAGAADQTDYYATAGGNLNLVGGLGAGNDGGGGGPGGAVNITSGASADVAGHAGNVTINTGGGNTWTFDYTGMLTVPGEGVINSVDDTITLRSFNTSTGNANSVYLGSSGGLGFNDQEAGGNWLEIFRNGAEPQITVPVGRGNLYIQTAEGANAYNWTFSNTGNLSAPGNITTTSNVSGGNISTTGRVSATGNIVTGGQIQSTAFSGGNISWSAANQTDFQGQIKIGGTGRLLSPGGAASITLNNNGANIPTLGVTIGTAASSTTTGALIVTGGAGLTGNIYAGGLVSVTGNITGGNIVTAGNVAGNTAGYAIGYRDIPQVSFTGNATIATTDAGKHYYSTLSTGNVLTIANNASQGFQVGAAITIINQGTGNITVAQGSGVTLYLAGNATSGNRTVATFGMATLIKVATDTWFINGTGVS